MYENKTWGVIFQMLRDRAEELGRAPHINDISHSLDLINGLKYGGWEYVLGYAGIYPRAGDPHQDDYPLFLEEFSDEQLIEMVRKGVHVKGASLRERDSWCYIECIYRWDSWKETLKICGIPLPDDYVESNPLPAPLDHLHKIRWKRYRWLRYRYKDASASVKKSIKTEIEKDVLKEVE